MKEVLLVGAGYMAMEYAKVLHGLGQRFVVVGRGEKSALNFEKEIGMEVIRGGLKPFLEKLVSPPSNAIVAVSATELCETAMMLVLAGVKNILLEKPGCLTMEEFQKLRKVMNDFQANISIAYNRRFFASVREAKQIIQEDGGVEAFHFEFTEWLHVLAEQGRLVEVLPYLFLGNSSHVADLAFFLGGKPKELSCYGKESLHFRGIVTNFSGAGRTEKGALFSYQANWEAPGRWSVEMMTRARRLIFRPLEKLQVQRMNSVQMDFADIDYTLDQNYKPGLYLETQAFLEYNEMRCDLCTLEDQILMLPFYQKIVV